MSHLRVAILLLLLSCGALLGGCTQGNSGDEAAATATVPLGLDRFLLFPNPIVDTGGAFQTDTNAFAQAYYSAVDPNGERSTLAAWKSKNQFGTGGQEFVAVFRDVRDLGYGRRMTGRRNADGSIAFLVENYNVSNVPGGYSQVNVDAAVVRDTQWHVGTNAIEWSPAQCTASDPPDCGATANFTKYFNFDPATGQRQNTLNLDGRGQKSMPGICVNCHGGRADPLTPQGTFALVENSLSRKRGDVQARLQSFNVDSFDWATTPGFRRADQEAVLKIFNQWVLCSYPGGGSVTGTWGTCNRPAAGANEWQGTAAALIENGYGGAALPNAQFSDTYLPVGWNTGGTNVQLYQAVVAPYCRTCHLLRGTANQSDIDFDSEAKFQSHANRIKAHVFDRGNMPLAWLVYQDFWRSNAPSILASYIDSVLGAGTATTSGGATKQPGRPIADPGPDRMVRTVANATLYGGDSLFATTYSWTLDPATPGATITNPNSPTATFSSSFAGDYTVHLTVSSRGQSDSKAVVITVDNTFRDPATIKFAHVKDVLQNGSTCTTCHLPRAVVQPSATPPIWYTDFDRNFSGGAADAIDDDWFYSEILGRVNLTEIGNSSLLIKPSRNSTSDPPNINHHNGGTVFDLAGTTGYANFSVIYNWILYGAQSGGVVASWAATITNPITFSGGTFAIPVNGSTSIGATNYFWSVVPNTIPPHPNGTPPVAVPLPFIAQPDPLLPGATLNVFDAGTYDVTLVVSNGIDVDQKTLTVDVQEAAVVANFTPHSGAAGTTADVSFNFLASPSTASVTLTATASGNPTSCLWQVSPAGPTLGSPTSCTSTTFVASTSQIGTTYTVTFTANNVTRQGVVSKGLTIQAAAGLNPNGADFTFPASNIGFTVSGNAANSPAARINSVATSTVTLTGSVTSGVPTLSYSWTTTAGTAGCSIAAGSSTSPTKSLTVQKAGTCSVTLTVSNGILPNDAVTKTVTIGSATSFATVGTILNGTCSACHSNAGAPVATPSWVNDSGLHGRLVPGFVNTGGPQSSSILVCPNTGSCGMVAQPGFSGADLSDYDAVLTWIINGAVSSP